jgi:DNA-binding CsgD family transcriptional regulator
MDRMCRWEREWLDLTAEMLAAPLAALPDELIAERLVATFDARGCAVNSRPVGTGSSTLRIWPAGRFRQREEEEIGRWAVERAPRFHPVLRYYLATGDTAACQVADVPERFAGPPGEWWELSRGYGIQHQLALPVSFGPGGHHAYVVGRANRAFTAAEMRLARGLQRLFIGLDRQASTLARWSGGQLGGRTQAAAAAGLTPREVAVLAQVAEGRTAAAAARRLTIAERTVHKHLERVYAKLGVSDRLSAVLSARRSGLLDADPRSA